MTKIAKNDDEKNSSKKSLQTLKEEFLQEKANLQKLIGKDNDMNNVSLEKKGQLRTCYSKLALLAKEIADRTLNLEEKEGYAEAYQKLSKRASEFGSTIKHEVPKTSFDDVKGLENVKSLVKSFAFMAKNKAIVEYYHMDGNLGMLMYGAPGTGKTMFAEAVAHEMNLPLFIVTPADIYKSYVGASEQAVKLLFEEIDACPEGAILFVDECESIFSKRKEDAQDYKAAVTTEFLQRMNGFGVDGANRIMIAATNRPDEIDPAYLRYKRFSFIVHITPPDYEAKKAILESKLQGIELSPDVSIEKLLEKTEVAKVVKGLSGVKSTQRFYYSAADLCGIIEETCRLAIEQIQESGGKTHIPLTMEMFDQAFDKIPPSISGDLLEEYENFMNKWKK